MKKNEQDYLEIIKGSIRKVLDHRSIEIKIDDHVMQDLHLDSMDFVDLISEIEVESGLQISVGDLFAFAQKKYGRSRDVTIQEIANYCLSLQS